MLGKIKSNLYSAALLLGKIKYNNRNSKVLYYHDVHKDKDVPETMMSTPLSLFTEHIRIIRQQGFEIVDVITQPKNQIMLTFDDGYIGIFKNKDFFFNQGLKPTVFIISNCIGTNTFMNANEIIFLQNKGFRFQSHTHTHPDLNLLSESEMKTEMITSKKILENFVNEPINEICFPKGLFNKLVLVTANEYGYDKLYSSIPGSFNEQNPFDIINRNLVQFSSIFDFNCILYGGLNIFRERYTKQHYHEE
ncbi:MAG: polysaccharide deacetylase family protein [Lutibacter sp.]|nr:polysaccharide deacetylase family protein [Lutibacter sp.]